jgi:hypothetical protein
MSSTTAHSAKETPKARERIDVRLHPDQKMYIESTIPVAWIVAEVVRKRRTPTAGFFLESHRIPEPIAG